MALPDPTTCSGTYTGPLETHTGDATLLYDS